MPIGFSSQKQHKRAKKQGLRDHPTIYFTIFALHKNLKYAKVCRLHYTNRD